MINNFNFVCVYGYILTLISQCYYFSDSKFSSACRNTGVVKIMNAILKSLASKPSQLYSILQVSFSFLFVFCCIWDIFKTRKCFYYRQGRVHVTMLPCMCIIALKKKVEKENQITKYSLDSLCLISFTWYCRSYMKESI